MISKRDPSPDTAQVPRRVVRFELSPGTIILVVLVLVAGWMLLKLAPVLLVLVGALMLVGALNPIVEWFERHRFRRGAAIGVVFFLAVGLMGLGLFLTMPSLVAQVRGLIEHEPEIRGRVITYLEASPMTRALADELRDVQYGALLKDSRAALLAASVRAVEIVAYTVATIFLALYIMLDRDRLRGAAFALVPRNHHVRTSRVLLSLETIVGGYIRGQVITCILIGVFIFVLLLVCHVPNALALAAFGALMDVLPYIGALLTIVPIVIAAYSVSPGIAVVVFALLLLYEEFESRVLVPLVYGRALRLPSSVVFFSLLVGGTLGGIVGALLALPIASAVLMLLNELRVELPGETEQPKDIVERKKDEREEREYEQRTEDVPAVEASAVAVELARERKEKENGKAKEKKAKK
jgi:predicted PurR-regulated permease PerM